MRKPGLSALLVHSEAEHFPPLESALASQSIHVRRAATCGEALVILHGWVHILRLATGVPTAVNVIVVARLEDTKLYLEALQEGAFDLITPPFVASDVAHVVRSAVGNVLGRRGKHSQAASRS